MSRVETMPDSNPKTKYGMRKPSLSLIPPVAMIQEAVVFGLGAVKYGPYNWRDTSVASRVYIDAAMRHMASWNDGEELDPESGASHLAHARACLGIILDAQSIGKLIDDRPPVGAAAATILAAIKKDSPPVKEPVCVYCQDTKRVLIGGSISAVCFNCKPRAGT